MSPVRFNRSPNLPISRAFISLLLVILLAACGSKAVATVPAQPHPSRTANDSASALASLKPNIGKINIQAGDLLIQSDAGFQCPSAQSGSQADQLVLASNRTSYSPNEIQQMRDYFGGNTTSSQELPSTLRWVLGGSIVPIPGTGPVTPETPCGVTLDLTNTGNAPIQIPKVSFQLEAHPQPNPYQYRLINYCSLIPISEDCYFPFGGGDDCYSYTASIQLAPKEPNDVFSTAPIGPVDANCGILTIAPSAQVETKLTIDFSLTPGSPNNLIYSLLPIFTIDEGNGEQNIPLSHTVSTLAFASVSQFSCYTLQGTTFVLETPALIPSLQWNWCM